MYCLQYGAELTPDQIRQCEELGILVDKDDQGVLLQLFTKPLGECATYVLVTHSCICTMLHVVASKAPPSLPCLHIPAS